MEKLRMPASYATLPEEELPEIFALIRLKLMETW